MSTWQTAALFVLAGCGIGCLIGICKTIQRLSEAVFFVRKELTKLNSKLEAVEAVNKDDLKQQKESDDSFEAIEAAISNFEKLKRIDVAKP